MTYLRANGVVLNIELGGRGEPVVLLADIGEDLTSWGFQAGAFGSLHFLVRLDNRGSGWSDCPPQGCSIDEMAKDVLHTMDLVGVDKAHIVGLGLGGMIAQRIALQRPGRVGGLVLASTSCRLTDQQRDVYDRMVSAHEGSEAISISRAAVPWLHSSWFLDNERWREYVIRARGSQYGPQYWDGLSAQLAAMADFDSSESLGRISSPTLVVSGNEDRLTPPGCAEELCSVIKGARRHELKAGHLLNVELPRSFNKVVLEFLAKVEGSVMPDLGPGIPLPWDGGLGL